MIHIIEYINGSKVLQNLSHYRVKHSKHRKLRSAIGMLTVFMTLCSGAFGESYRVNPDDEIMDSRSAIELIETSYAQYIEQEAQDDIRIQEISTEELEENVYLCELEYGGRGMRFLETIKGDPSEDGTYPLYITLHGGGAAEAEENDEQWLQMFSYYSDSVDSGIYISCRGIEDVWNMHFLPESYVLYDRLIEDMIIFNNVDPNRIYMLGFSAGGDGVYAIAPRMADRFAAVNMSSGHPNSVSLLNTANLPFGIQVGIRDFYSAEVIRSVRAAEFDQQLNGFHDQYGFGYDHVVWIHVPEGHNFLDNDPDGDPQPVLNDPTAFASLDAETVLNAFISGYLEVHPEWEEYLEGEESYAAYQCIVQDLSYDYSDRYYDYAADITFNELGLEIRETDTNAVHYVRQYTRNAHPAQIVWDLRTRANTRSVNSFYWLEADMSVDAGVITASYESETNTLTVTPDADVNGDFNILFTPYLMDIGHPITIVTPEGSLSVTVAPSQDVIRQSIAATSDAELAYVGKISYASVIEMIQADK